MKIAFVGLGEVGYCYAQAWTAAGHAVSGVCELRRDSAMQERAAQLNTVLHVEPGPWLQEADVVIGAVFGSAACEVAQACVAFMRPGTVYADFTTASAADMLAASVSALAAGVGFTDVAIMGAIALLAEATPLMCVGEGAGRVLQLAADIGAPAREISGQPGDAVRLKLLRSIMTKGMESLAVECLVAAEAMGLRGALYEVLADIDQIPLTRFMDAFVRSHVLHAGRRLAEVNESRDQLIEAGLQPLVLDGVAKLFARTRDGLLADQQRQACTPPDTVEDRLSWLAPLAAQRT